MNFMVRHHLATENTVVLIFDFIYNFLIPAKTLCCWRSSIKHLNTRYRLFMKGQNKFVKEFDSIEFARSQRKLKMFVHWLMNKSERFLAVYQKSNAISLTSESKSESDNPLYANIPKMLDNNEKKENHQAIVNRFLVSLVYLEVCNISKNN